MAGVALWARCSNVGTPGSKGEVVSEIIFIVARTIFDELGPCFEMVEHLVYETVDIVDLEHDDDSLWQVQHLGCLELMFRGRGTL